MKSWAVLGLLGLCCCPSAHGAEPSPLSSVIEVLHEMTAKIQKDAEAEAEAYRKFTDWCDQTARNNNHAVEDAAKQKEKLEAEIQQDKSEMEIAHSKVEELAASSAEAEAEMKKAKAVREKEVKDFQAGEKELMEMVRALGGAINILEKKGEAGEAALAQVDTTNMKSLVQALGAVLDAASFPTSDRSKLLALVQSKEADEDEPEAPAGVGPPDAAAYESKSGDIIEVLENMKEDAETQLAKLRQDELEAKGNHDLMMADLKNRLSDNAKEMDAQKGEESEASEHKAEDKGDLQVTAEDLQESNKELKTVQHACLTSAADHDTTVASRKEELATLAKAIEILQKVADGGATFVQVESQVVAALSKSQVAPMVKRLAKEHHSAALAQLATRIAAAVRSGAADPFAKVKAMISDMITKLEAQAGSEAKEKAYCDKEMGQASAKDESLEDSISETTATLDSSSSKSAQLKEQVKQSEGDLANLAKEQAELDQIRANEHEDYKTQKADLEQALQGVRQALGLLRSFYDNGDELAPPAAGGETAAMLQDGGLKSFMQQPAPPVKHEKAEGAGASIIEVIEMIESDLGENLAKVESQESDAQSAYDKLTGENQVDKATKDQDVKFMAKRLKSLATRRTESQEDKESFDSELAAVEDYLAKLKEKCVAKPETYEERAKRRQAEIKGLKEALKTLEEEAALLQRGRRSRRRRLRAQRPALDMASSKS